MLTLAFISFIAGILTILAPCVLPVLPVILAGSLSERQRWYPYIVTLSLAISIVLFTILLKASTIFIDIPGSFWKYLSGSILLALGLVYIFPHAWTRIGVRLGFSRSNISLDHAQDIGSPLLRAIATGAALGPVFSTCSPTYSLLLATVFPVSFVAGIGYTLIYAIGLSLMLTIIAIGGRSIIARFRNIADEKGWFKRVLGIIFILIGLAIITGIDKKIEAAALNIFNISYLEESILDTLMPKKEIVPISQIEPVSPVAVIPVVDIPAAPTPSLLPLPIVVPEAQKPTPVTVKALPIIKPKEVTPEKPVVTEISRPVRPAPPLSVTKPYGAPPLSGLSDWINSDPLTLAGLRGQVVIVEFWTFGCSNCQATIPHVEALYEKYRDQGLVVIGVHAPEFAYEQKYENVLAAVKKAGITYPVALDNGFSTWSAYNNQYWPAMYIIDKTGNIRHTHFGEGQYAETDEIVRYLLAE